MTILILGVLLWSVVHLIPVFMPDLRAGIISQIRPGPYRGMFTLFILISIVLMVWGWRSVDPVYLYDLPDFSRYIMMFLVLLSLMLFASAGSKSRLRRFIRHPMLAGVIVWAIAHLLVNGDNRSLVLFGGLIIWSVVAIIGSNLRDGPKRMPRLRSWGREARMVFVSLAVYAVLVFGHPYFAGIALF